MPARTVPCCALVLLLACLPARAAELPPPVVVKVSERVHALLGPVEIPNAHNRGYMVNSVLIVGDRGVTVVDTGSSHEIGEHLKKAMRAISAKPVTRVVNTHHHGDHVLGNTAFAGSEIASSENCRKLVQQLGYEWIAMMEGMVGSPLPGTRPVAATVTYPALSKTPVELDGVRMEYWVPAGSHTPGDLMILLPDEKILIAGDVLVNEIVPNMRDASLKNWIATLEAIMAADVKIIIPGHGPLMTQDDVQRLHRMFVAFYQGVEAGYKKGLQDADLRQSMDLSEWQKLKEFDVIMGTNISHTWLEVEAANF